MTRKIRSMEDYRRFVRGDRSDEHGFLARAIECKCGRTFSPERFEKHLNDESAAEFQRRLTAKLREVSRV